jgi:hypothetical protein
MQLEQIRAAINHRPFQPLMLRLIDGRRLYVPYPGILAIAANRLIVRQENGLAEAAAWFASDQIESIDTKEVPMNLEAVRQAIRRQPFRPFSLRLVDGREMPVPHPEFVAISGRTVIITNAVNEAYAIVEPLLIVSIEYPQTAPETADGATEGGSNP